MNLRQHRRRRGRIQGTTTRYRRVRDLKYRARCAQLREQGRGERIVIPVATLAREADLYERNP